MDHLRAVERRLLRISLALVAAGTLFVWAVFSWPAALSFLAGSALAGANLLWLYATVNMLVFDDRKRSKFQVLAGFFLRLSLIPLGLYAMIRFLYISVPAAVAGFAVLNCSVFIEGILEAFESRSK